MCKRHGFTLVELMVVIAIIAALASILFPVLARAREKAWQVACISNQRQIALRIAEYAMDHDETMPQKETVWQDLALDRRLLICPTAGKVVPNAYVYPAALSGLALGEILNPCEIIILGDGAAENNIAFGNSDYVARHNGYYILAYADGHVALTDELPGSISNNEAEWGQIIEGVGSANFGWLQVADGRKFGVAFRAPRSGSLAQITLQWKKSSGYGAGSYGLYHFEIQTNGAGNFPSGTAIGVADGIDPVAAMGGYQDGALSFPIQAELAADTNYHLVITNIDPNCQANWSSPNTLMTRVQPWDGTGCRSEVFLAGAWTPWTSVENPWNTTGQNDINGSHCPLMLSWDDGACTGDPYYSAYGSEPANFYGANRFGEYINWSRPAATITQIGISVAKQGTPGTLYYHLETAGGNELATGSIPDAVQAGTSAPEWVYAKLPAPITLMTGQAYRLWFASPDSTSGNCYFQSPPYADVRPPNWFNLTWGGPESCLTVDIGSGWQLDPTADLSFSLK